jgi:NAD(P)H-flavin reductase
VHKQRAKARGRHAERGIGVTIALTREQPPGWTGLSGRLTPQIIREHVWPVDGRPSIFVCGSTTFVEAVADSRGRSPSRRHQDRTILGM